MASSWWASRPLNGCEMVIHYGPEKNGSDKKEKIGSNGTIPADLWGDCRYWRGGLLYLFVDVPSGDMGWTDDSFTVNSGAENGPGRAGGIRGNAVYPYPDLGGHGQKGSGFAEKEAAG